MCEALRQLKHKQNYKVIRIWEHEIRKDAKSALLKVVDFR